MKQNIEKEITVSHVSVQLSTFNWDGVEEQLPETGYALSQRLSGDHAPVRIGNLSVPVVLPRVRSVGLLPLGHSVRMFPVEKPLRVICCLFEEDFFEDTTGVARAHWYKHIESLVSIRNQRLEVMMQEIYGELNQPGFGHDLLIEAASTMILVELGRFARQLDGKSSTQANSLALAPWQLRCIQERIEASLAAGYPDLAELAGLCGISQGHLARSFKSSTGWQIHRYIIEERLKMAKALLIREQISCEDIARRLGFKNAAYFSTFFRRRTGTTPTAFRREARTGRAGIMAQALPDDFYR